MYEHYHYDYQESEQDPPSGCLGSIIGIILAILLCALFSLLSSCTTTRIVEVETVRTDTIHLNHYQRDSIYLATVLHDSVALTQRGDTILIDRWHTRTLTEYRDRWLHDSIYIATHDTIPAPYPVEKLVEKQLSWWQQLQIWLGRIILLSLAIAALVWLIRKRAWFLKFFP